MTSQKIEIMRWLTVFVHCYHHVAVVTLLASSMTFLFRFSPNLLCSICSHVDPLFPSASQRSLSLEPSFSFYSRHFYNRAKSVDLLPASSVSSEDPFAPIVTDFTKPLFFLRLKGQARDQQYLHRQTDLQNADRRLLSWQCRWVDVLCAPFGASIFVYDNWYHYIRPVLCVAAA